VDSRFAATFRGVVVVSVVARRGRAAAAMVSYSLPRLVTTFGGAAVDVDLVGIFTPALALLFAFLGGMLAVDCAVCAVLWNVVSRVNVASRS